MLKLLKLQRKCSAETTGTTETAESAETAETYIVMQYYEHLRATYAIFIIQHTETRCPWTDRRTDVRTDMGKVRASIAAKISDKVARSSATTNISCFVFNLP